MIHYFEATWSSLSTSPIDSSYVQLSAIMMNHTRAVPMPTIKNNWFYGAQVLINFLDATGTNYQNMDVSITGSRVDLSKTSGGNSGFCAVAQEARSTLSLTWSGNINTQTGATINGPVYL